MPKDIIHVGSSVHLTVFIWNLIDSFEGIAVSVFGESAHLCRYPRRQFVAGPNQLIHPHRGPDRYRRPCTRRATRTPSASPERAMMKWRDRSADIDCYLTGWGRCSWTWVGLTLILDIPLPASFCLGGWRFGKMANGGGQDDGRRNQKLKSTQLRSTTTSLARQCRIQGDTSGWRKPPVDIDLKVVF